MPENPNIQFQLAVVLFDLAKQGQAGAEVKAIDRLKRTIVIQPSHADAHLLMGQIHQRNNRFMEMLQSWEQAGSGANDHLLNYLNIFVFELRKGLDRLDEQLSRSQTKAEVKYSTTRPGLRNMITTLIMFFLIVI